MGISHSLQTPTQTWSRNECGRRDDGVCLTTRVTHYHPLQHTTTRCNTLQNTEPTGSAHCRFRCGGGEDGLRLQVPSNIRVAVCCSVLQCVAVCCSVLQCVTVCCSVLQCVAVCCSVLQCVTVCCSVLQCVAVCCSVVQCVAVCCSVLQCVGMIGLVSQDTNTA